MFEDGFGAFLGFMGVFMFFAIIIAIVLYVIFALGLMTLARRRGIENDFLAFVPIAQLYIFGLIIKELKIFSYDVPSPELVLPISGLASMFLAGIPLIGWLIPLANLVLIIGAYYRLYMIYTPQNALIYTILSPFIGPFLVYSIRNNNPSSYTS